MRTPCDNHPAKAGENLCDSCDCYLCAECLGAPVNRLGRLYYFCNKEACRQAYLSKVKKEGFALAGLIVSALIVMVASVTMEFDLLNLGFVIWVRVTVSTGGVKLWREYRQRQMQ
jgi:hypothetical protein